MNISSACLSPHLMELEGWQRQHSRQYVLTCSSQNSVADFWAPDYHEFKMTGAGDGSGCSPGRTVCKWEEMMLQKIQSYHLDVADSKFIKCFWEKKKKYYLQIASLLPTGSLKKPVPLSVSSLWLSLVLRTRKSYIPWRRSGSCLENLHLETPLVCWTGTWILKK